MAPEPDARTIPEAPAANPLERALDTKGDPNNGLGTVWAMLGTFFSLGAFSSVTEAFGGVMDSFSEVGVGNGGFDFNAMLDRLGMDELGIQPAAPAPTQPAPVVQAMAPGRSGPV
jgi:hypothetical protein